MNPKSHSKKPDNPESICLTARQRARGDKLSQPEVYQYLALLKDERWVDDPDDPPSYDWTGGAPLAGGGQMQVRAEAAQTLRACGQDELANVLKDAFSKPDADREYLAQLAIELLGPEHPFVAGLLCNESANIRCMAIQGFAQLGGQNRDNIQVLAPLLVDPSDEVVSILVPLLRDLGIWITAAPAGAFPEAMIAQAREALPSPLADTRFVRLECFFFVAVLTGSWKELAELLSEVPAEEVCHIAEMGWCFNRKVLLNLLEQKPSLRAVLKMAIVGAFQKVKVGWRHIELGLLCCFAPDLDVFALAMSEVHIRPSGASDLVSFIEQDPGLMSLIVETVLERARETQVDAIAMEALMKCDLKLFADAIKSKPESRGQRLKKLEAILRNLPSRHYCDELMTRLRAKLDSSDAQ